MRTSQAIEPPAESEHATLRRDLERAVRKACPPALSASVDDFVQLAMLKVMALEKKRASEAASGAAPGGSDSTHTVSTPDAGNDTRTSSYLYRVAYSVVVDEIRRVTRRSEVALDDSSEDLPVMPQEPTANAPSPEQSSQARQFGRGINDCLHRLVASRRRAVVLYLLGHTVPETARLMDANLKRTESLVYRGLADLRHCLTKKGIEP